SDDPILYCHFKPVMTDRPKIMYLLFAIARLRRDWFDHHSQHPALNGISLGSMNAITVQRFQHPGSVA
ncbi:14096_t:CDS:2, partial [Dentiscutata heterogama]